MTTEEKRKGFLINEILGAVNTHHEGTKSHNKPSKKADGNLFFSLAFCEISELEAICKKSGIKI